MVEDNNVECVHPNEPIKVDDFVVATRDIADIQRMSVGLVKEIYGNKIIEYFDLPLLHTSQNLNQNPFMNNNCH